MSRHACGADDRPALSGRGSEPIVRPVRIVAKHIAATSHVAYYCYPQLCSVEISGPMNISRRDRPISGPVQGIQVCAALKTTHSFC